MTSFYMKRNTELKWVQTNWSNPITFFKQMFHFYAPENIGKYLICRWFQGVKKGYIGNKWVNKRKLCLEAPTRGVIKKAVLKNFAIFRRKHLYCSLFLIKLQTFRPVTLLKRDSNTGVFLWILRNFYKHLFCRTLANGCFCLLYLLQSACNTDAPLLGKEILWK